MCCWTMHVQQQQRQQYTQQVAYTAAQADPVQAFFALYTHDFHRFFFWTQHPTGASSTDYGRMSQQLRLKAAPTAYDATAATLSVASGRLSYTFSLRGPAVTVDTVSFKRL